MLLGAARKLKLIDAYSPESGSLQDLHEERGQGGHAFRWRSD